MFGNFLEEVQENIGGLIWSIVFVIFGIVRGFETAVPAGIICLVISPVTFFLAFKGWMLGLKFTEHFAPDAVMYTSTWGLIKTKFFWRWMPQIIGCFLGSAITAGIIVGIFQ